MGATPIVALFVALMLLPATASAQQPIESGSMLGIELVRTQPTYYTDDEGYTVVVGEINNLKEFPVTDVRIIVNFYTQDYRDSPRESQIGGTILGVVPAMGTSPYMIRSHSQDLDIYGVSADLLGFTSSPVKTTPLELGDVTARASGELVIGGTVTNNAQADVANAVVYALVYDALEPPRLIVIDSVNTGSLPTDSAYDFQFSLPDYERALFVRLIAESDNYTSEPVDIPVTRYLAEPLVIQNIATVDAGGNPVSSIHRDAPVYLQSRITGQDVIEIEYTYIVQIKRSEALPLVEFIGTSDGLMTDSGVSLSLVEWTPETSGHFFVETYVWNMAGTPLSVPGPVSLLHVR